MLFWSAHKFSRYPSQSDCRNGPKPPEYRASWSNWPMAPRVWILAAEDRDGKQHENHLCSSVVPAETSKAGQFSQACGSSRHLVVVEPYKADGSCDHKPPVLMTREFEEEISNTGSRESFRRPNRITSPRERYPPAAAAELPALCVPGRTAHRKRQRCPWKNGRTRETGARFARHKERTPTPRPIFPTRP